MTTPTDATTRDLCSNPGCETEIYLDAYETGAEWRHVATGRVDCEPRVATPSSGWCYWCAGSVGHESDDCTVPLPESRTVS